MSQQELEKRIADLECTLRQAANVIQHGLEHIKALKAENARLEADLWAALQEGKE